MINIVILLYRDCYFLSEFGPAVRDLQFLFELEKNPAVSKITIINRPVSIVEMLCGRKIKKRIIKSDKITTLDSISYDLLGPLKGRSWSEYIYNDVLQKKITELYDDNCINVLLDFLPIGRFSVDLKNKWFYWYDLIDNFTKHNRFSDSEKSLVRKKYDFVKKNADIVTGVSIKALDEFPSDIVKKVIPNRIYGYISDDRNNNSFLSPNIPIFDFGFVGFITDKFDFSILEELGKKYTIAIYGKCFDRKIKDKIISLKNVHYFGQFKYAQLQNIIPTFKVGLLPYILQKSHDESPLKIYEYLKYNRPCLTSIDYEVNSKYIINYNDGSYVKYIEKILDMYKNENITSAITKDMYLYTALDGFLNNNILNRVRSHNENFNNSSSL
ncbi:glycosyl transferase [Citrobacter braakii]|uniref:glycosyl transferase n=1 Tax=Citrobacter braakii TaxID=57706 RepID=UPI00103EDD40|nr:glycosyl transferase [Citrobacter braakii]TCC92559.1 glycosyl transferase [Citrobacter braakii]HAT7502873.1 glycosyltransferase family 1 protein [Citrobacter braakii]